jgi:hypothetical protein
MTVIHPETTWPPVGRGELTSRKFRRSLPADRIGRPLPSELLRALAVSRPPVRRSYGQELNVSRATQCAQK